MRYQLYDPQDDDFHGRVRDRRSRLKGKKLAEKIRKILGVLELEYGPCQERGPWKNFRCPFHQGSRFNFGVNLSSMVYVCLGCGVSGGLEGLPGKMEEEGHGDFEAGGILPDIRAEIPEGEDDRSSASSCGSPPHSQIPNPAWESGYTHLKVPGGSVSEKTAVKYLLARGLLGSGQPAFPVGLHVDLPGRVVFPFHEDSKTVYYVARDFTGTQQMKVLNPDSEKGWRKKGQVLYGIDYMQKHKQVVICEGIFDTLSVIRHTGILSTCLLGKTITDWQKSMLRKYSKGVYVCLDADAFQESVNLASELFYAGIPTRLCMWNKLSGVTAKDPNECTKDQLSHLIRSAEPFDYVVEMRLRALFP